jgi:diaminopimelate decarboxylase
VQSAVTILGFLTVAGCAVAASTSAQGLAEERVRQCDHFASVQLARIDTDGGVWVTYRVSAEEARWRACMEKAADAHVARGATVKSRALYSERVAR